MNQPTSDNCCTRMGWIKLIVSCSWFEVQVSIEPDTDTAGSFKAFCHDNQEMITINGWMTDDITESAQHDQK